MPLSVSVDTARAGPATRKRTYDQITRSQSRSQTPTLPAKRRRTDNSEHRSPGPSRGSALRSVHSRERYVGDGFDYRRPTAAAMAQAVDQTTIDLTLEENTPPPDSPGSLEEDEDDDLDYLFDTSDFSLEQPQTRAPPFNRQRGQDPTEPITISDSDDENAVLEGQPPPPPESPEVQWVGERQIHRRLPPPNIRNLPSLAEVLNYPDAQLEGRRATPPELRRADAQSFADTLRNAPGALFDFGRNILGAAMGPVVPPTAMPFEGLGPIPANRSWINRQIPTPLNPAIYDDLDDDDYAAIDLDYQDVGFPMGGLEILDPDMNEAVAAAAAAAEEAYKPPPIAKEGFTRDIEEEGDVLICVSCEDELATGEDEVKQQVWVAKSCGHVFCGSCASQRTAYRKGNDRDRKRTKRPKIEQLKECKAPNCGSKLTGKTAMFQVYL